MISIIVPVYNVKDYLNQCVNSICNQSYHNLEIILVDDGSTDGCGELCDALSQKDERIKVLHKPNGGIVSARKAGILASSGEYIGYVDGDDWIEHSMYEQLIYIMENQNVDIAMCGRYEDTGDKRKEVYQGLPEGRYDQREMQEKIFPRMIVNDAFFEWGLFPGMWDKLFKRDIVYQLQLDVDERIVMGEDAACAYPAILKAKSIYILHQCFYHYRQTTTSMVKTCPERERERLQFKTMYSYTRSKLQQFQKVYDFTEQWNQYVLFLMTARADGLYNGYQNLNYLFPFSNVKRGERIVIYGAGTYGQRLYKYLDKTSFCSVVVWVDQNYIELRKMGLDVYSPDVIDNYKFDHIVVAITYAKARLQVYQYLLSKYEKDLIELISEEEICSDRTIQAFGLN